MNRNQRLAISSLAQIGGGVAGYKIAKARKSKHTILFPLLGITVAGLVATILLPTSEPSEDKAVESDPGKPPIGRPGEPPK